jgi:hypothetical protein
MVCSGVRKDMLRDVRYDILFAPYGHHVPPWERIQGYFSPTHWGICLLKMSVFYSLDRRSEFLFRAYVKADFVTSTPLCRLPMGTPWLLVRRDLSKWVREKKTRFLSTLSKVTTFSLLSHAPPCTCVCESRKTASLKISEGLYLTNLATGNPNLDPNRPENEI